MRVEITHTTALLPRGQFVQWTLRGATESGDYLCTVERSGSLNGPWDMILDAAASQYAVQDDYTDIQASAVFTPVNNLTFLDRVYYRVTVKTPSGEVLQDIKPTGPSNASPSPADRRMSQARRHLKFDFLRGLRYTGVPVRLFKRRQWGVRCSKCWDPRTKLVMRADCRLCWGTGFEGGYWAPYDTRAVRSSLNNTVVSGVEAKAEGSSASVILPEQPQLERDDLIVSLEDQRRFLVWSQRQPEIQLQGVYQILECLELARDHVLYKLPAQPGVVEPLF